MNMNKRARVAAAIKRGFYSRIEPTQSGNLVMGLDDDKCVQNTNIGGGVEAGRDRARRRLHARRRRAVPGRRAPRPHRAITRTH